MRPRRPATRRGDASCSGASTLDLHAGTQKKLNANRNRAAAAAAEELAGLDAELVRARRQKLKDLYEADYGRYQEELEAMGLSLNYE